jgi:glycosyltransferase involved in cell wall biosynthesis
MRAANLRLALKLDSSFGLNRFPRHAAVWFRKCYWVARERHPPATALAKAFLDMAKWIRGVDVRTMVPYLEQFDSITAESPMARDNTRDWLTRHRRPDLAARVEWIPHPVPDDFAFDPSLDTKENSVLAVAADWTNPRKGGMILARALDRFLAARPDWRATVVGANSNLVVAAAPRARDRIDIRPPLESSLLLPLYKSAKTLLIASGSESGPIVAFEALACGCSVVFPPELLQLSWIADAGLGAMSRARTPATLALALEHAATSITSPSIPLPPLHASDILVRLLDTLSRHPYA